MVTRTRPVRGYIVFAFACGLVLTLAYVMRDILLLLYVSVLFAVVLSPVIRGIMLLRIRNWHPGKGLAILLLLLSVAGAATLFFAFAMPPVLHDLQALFTELPTRGPQVLDNLHRIRFISHLNFAGLNAKLQGFASNIAEYLFLSLSGWAGKLADIAAVIFLTIYFMLEGDEAYRWALSFFPAKARARLNETLMRADVRMGKWLLGQGSLMLILGISSLIVFVLLNVRYAYALAVLMGVLNIIPIVGALISMSLVLLAAATDSWEKVVGVAVFYAIYAQVETSFLTPRIMKSSVDLSALGVLIALLMGSKLAGVLGAMIAVPTAVLVSELLHEYLVKGNEGHVLKDGKFAWYHEVTVTPTVHAATSLAASSVDPVPTLAKTAAHSRFADYQELFKVRVTSMVVITAWAGFYLGSMRSGITSMQWGLLQSLLGIGLVSCGASVMNQVIERKTDARMLRTAQRPLAAGRFSLMHGLVIGLACFASGALVLAWFTNPATVVLTLLTGFLYVGVYTPLKRYTTLATFIGAFPGAMPPLLGWTAARGAIEWPAVALFAILFVWQFPHFMAIAWLYRDDYAKAGIRMLPVVEPDGWSTACQALIYAVLMIPVSAAPYYLHLTGPVYLIAAVLFGLGYLAYTIRFARITRALTTAESRGYARDLLRASVIYLPLLLAVMMLTATGRR